ncbi:MAG TPA: hypothetical protein VIM87_19530, partial [Chitinophaga sp.]|uniref:hypothetical protein n=1 Tax=Chitinophaga sp. TaxID=1869181 RepID=UPI002F95F59E
SPSDSTALEYNTDGTLRRFANISFDGLPPDTSLFIYPFYENGRMKRYSFTRDINDPVGKIMAVLTYNSAGQVVQIDHPESTSGTAYDSLVYNSQGQLTATYAFTSTAKTDTTVNFYTWEKNNLVKNVVTNTYIDGATKKWVTTTRTYRYEDKPNPYRSIAHYYYFLGDPQYLSVNNKVEESFSTTNGFSGITTYTYEYNSDSYPVSAVRTVALTLAGNTETHVYEGGRFHYLPK